MPKRLPGPSLRSAHPSPLEAANLVKIDVLRRLLSLHLRDFANRSTKTVDRRWASCVDPHQSRRQSTGCEENQAAENSVALPQAAAVGAFFGGFRQDWVW